MTDTRTWRGSLDDAVAFIRARRNFECGNVTGVRYYEDVWWDKRGKKPRQRPGNQYPPSKGWNSFLAPEPGVRYAVFSYNTPIAWIDRDGVAVIPRQSHSHSTSRHQRIVHCCLDDDPGGNARDRERARRRYAKAQAAWDKEIAEAKAEEARWLAARRRERQREERRLARIRQQEEAAAVASILGQGAGGIVVYGVEGEGEAIKSIAGDAYTRDALGRRIVTRT